MYACMYMQKASCVLLQPKFRRIYLIFISAHTYTQTYIHTYTHTHIHTYMHTNIHLYIPCPQGKLCTPRNSHTSSSYSNTYLNWDQVLHWVGIYMYHFRRLSWPDTVMYVCMYVCMYVAGHLHVPFSNTRLAWHCDICMYV